MRTVSPASLAKLQQQFGGKPLNIIEVQWVIDGPISSYADRDFGIIKGKINSLGPIEDVAKLDDGAGAQQVEVVLDDTDGSLKTIFDANDIHKRDCWIYQAFDGLPASDKFLLMQGQISSPIVWDEGTRTLQFTVLSKIEDAEVGFSIEEGQFPTLPVDLIGKPWPLVFGTCLNVPALKITSPREGILAKSFGIVDFTLAGKLKLANNIFCSPTYNNGVTNGPISNNPNPNPGGVGNQGSLAGTPAGYQYDAGGNGPNVVPSFGASNECAFNKCQVIEGIKLQIKQQTPYQYDSLIIYGGEQFQQGQTVSISVDGAHLIGKFTGNRFDVITRLHKDIVDLGVTTVEEAIAKMIENDKTNTIKSKCPGGTYKTQNDKSADSFQKVTDYPSSSFQWIPAGSTVTFAFDEETVYIANLMPTQILRVSAYRTINSARRLLTVPTAYYSTRVTDYTSYLATEIVFEKPLSQLGEGWEDDIYVTQSSPVGPNTVDIMEWLIEKYTSYDIDSTSFDAVRIKTDTYPMHFPLLERKNILTLLEEMAFQARCSIWLKNGKFYIKYLSEEPTSDSEIIEDDVDHQTLQIMTTDTEEIVTKFTATWKDDSVREEPNKLILRHNVKKYGTQAQEFDFYCYNNLDLVRKSATFWLIRYANTWKKVVCRTPLHKLQLETLDTVSLTLPDLADGVVKGIVNSARFSSEANSIDFEIWTPVLSGTRTSFPFAWPSTVDETLEWPTPSDVEQGLIGSGDAPGFPTIAPPGHVLSSNVQSSGGGEGQEITYQMGPGLCDQPYSGSGIQYSFCCDSAFNSAQFCEKQKPKNTNDNKDNKPPAKGEPDDSGEINTGPEPKFADGTPTAKDAQKAADTARNDGQRAADTANSANETAGGAGSSGQPPNKPTNPYANLPEPGNTDNPKKDENDPRPTCFTTVTVSWFPIKSVMVNNQPVCVPADNNIYTETFEYAGSSGCDDFQTGDICDGGYSNPPCCHGFIQCIAPDPGSCAEGEKDGQLTGYKATQAPRSNQNNKTPYTGLSWNQPGSGGIEPGPLP